ncbi:uncharacterized protein LOC134244763 [Saccostrea cucullata]|uniref:uncharacterized protein LOC134244763 n=1 Tax=Saccostrea cuccullata TaxID=36930 RepID=UPI002ED6BC5B
MYTFVTACLMEDNDLEFFLSEASSDVILEYCRSWEYERSERERCLYIPYRPEKMINALIDKLQMNIISHCTISDENVHDSICERLEVPREVLFWEQEARERYVEYAKRGTQTVHHARGMIVGCAGAGKTTLLKRLLRCSEEEIMNVKSTEVLDVHEEIIDENQSLKATSRTTKYSFEERPSKTLTFFDFGGQCVYYACHQIYLTGRAFYIVVVDASKDLNEKTDGNVCDQNGSLFSEWTYGDYFEFWIKSIHTFCGREKKMINRPIVLIVATHWEKTNYKSEEEFVERLQQNFPKNSNLLQYVDKDSCFFTQFPITPLEALEKRIVEIASQKRWREEIPKGWAFFEIEINQRKAERKMLDLSDIVSKNTEDNKENNERKDMLRYYHDAGKVLYFNEDGLEKWIIIDVQWFVNVFKGIITDKLHLKGIEATWLDWDDYYNTGCLRKEVLMEIFKRKENKNATANFTVRENQASHKSDITVYYVRDETQSSGKKNIDQSSPYLLNNLDIILNFMQRLGLIAKGENYHYIPCMNRKTFDKSILNMIGETHEKTSILLFHFKYLPYFLYFRLVVACLNLEGWIALKNKSTSCLYKNAAFFSYNENIIAIAVTETSIQLQVYIPNDESHTSVEITRDIQGSVEKILKKIATTFHRRVEFERGFSCMNENEQYITIDMEEHFIPGKSVKIGSKVSCPLHRFEGRHFINTSELMRFWDFDAM